MESTTSNKKTNTKKCYLCKIHKYTTEPSYCARCNQYICEDCWVDEDNKGCEFYSDLCYNCTVIIGTNEKKRQKFLNRPPTK